MGHDEHGTGTTRRGFLHGLAAVEVLAWSGLLQVGCGRETGDTGLDDAFTFAVISDLHLHGDPEHPNAVCLAETVGILNAHAVDLVVVTGDLVDELPSEDPAYYDEHPDTALHLLRDLLGGLDMPVLPVMGNHDYYLDDSSLENALVLDMPAREALFDRVLGTPGPWYRVDHGGVAFYGLSSMQPDSRAGFTPDACGSFGEAQLAWLEEQLADGVPAVLFFHHPLALDRAVEAGPSGVKPFEVPRAEGDYEKYEGTAYEGWTDPIYEILERFAGQILGVFVGHGHWWVEEEYRGMPVRMTESTGNSLLMTSVEVDGEEQPMRYHLVRVSPAAGVLWVENREWIDYER